jgi:hypothetical protein
MAKLHPLLLIAGGVLALELVRPGSTPLRGLMSGGGLRLPAFGPTPAPPVVSPWERLGVQAGQTGLTWLGGVLGEWFRSGSPSPLPAIPDVALDLPVEYPWLDTFDWSTISGNGV